MDRCKLTRIGDLDLDHSPVEVLAIKGQSLLEAIESLEFDITETLGALQLTVLDKADVDDTTVSEIFTHGVVGNIVGKVAQVSGIRRLVGEGLRGSFANGETCAS